MFDKLKSTDAPHHPLPASEKARHNEIPETIERERDLGDDDGRPNEDSARRRARARPEAAGRVLVAAGLPRAMIPIRRVAAGKLTRHRVLAREPEEMRRPAAVDRRKDCRSSDVRC